MAESEELKRIKKMYGENFMKLCRSLFPTLLEKEGLLSETLSKTFSNNSRSLYDDIIRRGLEGKFKDYIYNKIDVEGKEPTIIESKTPYEILDKVGYVLKECTTEKQIQSFKKYYEPNEELCTFSGGRLKSCVVFWAVKKNVEDIKRKDFKEPKREDEYGTSVMSIQFSKEGMCTVSIKNRYNHSVNNPDATYGNDLEKIAPGLEYSFTELLAKRGLNLYNTNKEAFEFPGYTLAGDGKYYKYNMEINGAYYCPGNIVIKDGEVHQLENLEQKILMDYFVLDSKDKTISLYDQTINDGFVDDLQDISKIDVKKDKEKGTKIITLQRNNESEPVIIEIDEFNQIVGYDNKTLTQTQKPYMQYNEQCSKLNLPNLERVGDSFLENNYKLSEFETPKLKRVGNDFLAYNRKLTRRICSTKFRTSRR